MARASRTATTGPTGVSGRHSGNTAYVGEVADEMRKLMLEMADEVDRDQMGSPREEAQRLVALVPRASPWSKVVGPVYTTAQVRTLFGSASRQAVADRVKRHTLLALRTSDGHIVYPVFQFEGRDVVSGLSSVLHDVGDAVDDWTLASWLRAPQPLLSRQSVVGYLAKRGYDEAVAEVTGAAVQRWRQ